MSAGENRQGILPPTWFFVYILIIAVVHFTYPVIHLGDWPIRLIGIPLLIVGLWLNLWADGLFKRCRTTVKPYEISTALITDGPFKFTRNPMYLGMAAALLGEAFLLGSLAGFIPVAIYPVHMYLTYIAVEERALTAAFGDEFISYKSRVRRWL